MFTNSLVRIRAAAIAWPVACMIAIAAPAFAGPVYLSQTRQVSANEFFDNVEGETISADNFDPFDETAEYFFERPEVDWSDVHVSVLARATQKSSLTSSAIDVMHTLLGEADGDAQNNAFAETRSIFRVTFRLDEAHYFSMSGMTWDTSRDGADIQLEFPEQSLQLVGGGPNFFNDESGILAAGTYSFQSAAYLSVGETSSGWINFGQRLELTPVNGSAPAVPLPPGAWAGMITLAGAVFGTYAKRRKSA